MSSLIRPIFTRLQSYFRQTTANFAKGKSLSDGTSVFYIVHAWAETWRRFWGGPKIFSWPNFRENFHFQGKNVHFQGKNVHFQGKNLHFQGKNLHFQGKNF